jgi:hypothetical protein
MVWSSLGQNPGQPGIARRNATKFPMATRRGLSTCCWLAGLPRLARRNNLGFISPIWYVAFRHDPQVTDRDFKKAADQAELGGAKCGARVVQKAVQSGVAGGSREPSTSAESPGGDGFRSELEGSEGSWRDDQITRLGFEPSRALFVTLSHSTLYAIQTLATLAVTPRGVCRRLA